MINQQPASFYHIPPYAQRWLDTFAQVDPDPKSLTEALQALRNELDWAFEEGDYITGLLHGWSAGVDATLSKLWVAHGLDRVEGISLVAVGGYGRRELHPGSDIDLLILLETGESAQTAEEISRFLTTLWDIKLDVGHSVRTLTECMSEAAGDLTIMTNLLESRVITGSKRLFDQLRASMWDENVWPIEAFYKGKLDEQNRRHNRFGKTAYRLEPNLKESPGGLRDFQMVKWLSIRLFHTDTISDLVREKFLTESEYTTLLSCRDFLWRLRYALHYHTGRKEDRLLFDYQMSLADLFGYRMTNRNQATEALMREYYRTVMTMDRLCNMLMQLFDKAIIGRQRPKPVKKKLAEFYHLKNGYLDFINERDIQAHPQILLEIFLILIKTPEAKQIGVKSIRLLRHHLHLIDEQFRRHPQSRALFMEILRQPTGITRAMRCMNSYGVLGRYIPAFDAITGLMQFDMFHIFTVDEHTLMVLRNTRRLSVDEHAHEHPEAHRLFKEMPKPELLYLAALFHDIAKGRGGDHAELGGQEARTFCQEHGLSQFDTELVVWLVEQHLVMSMTAQRKDISDIDVIRDFASMVQTPLRLLYLYLLTVSDIMGTDPELWNDWKAKLISSLYHRTNQWLTQITSGADQLTHAEVIGDNRLSALRAIAQTDLDESDALKLWEDVSSEYFRRYEPEEIVWHTRMLLQHKAHPEQKVFVTSAANSGATEILIYAPSHPGFFMLATRGIEQLGLNIMAAKAYSTLSGMALDTFSVLEDDGKSCDTYRTHEIRERLNMIINNPDGKPPEVRQPLPRQLKSFDMPPQITFSNSEEWHDTLLDLSAPDYPGLLADVASVLFQNDIALKLARIATVSERAQDILHIETEDQQPLNREQQEALRAKLSAVINARLNLRHQ